MLRLRRLALFMKGRIRVLISHAYGNVFDNPDLIACCVVGDGEAETGPMAASWHSK
jgi:xylulose-5-phosphate/fructose-6-phosphate phosphoketolase